MTLTKIYIFEYNIRAKNEILIKEIKRAST